MGDKDFLKAYEQYADAIFRHCYFRLYDREEALDLSQETFLRVWEYLSRGKQVENLKAFLYKVANNRIIDELRKRGRYVSLDVLQDDGFDAKYEGGTDTTDSIDGTLALSKVKELPDIYAGVILMRYVDSLSISEIAAALDESENTVSVRLHRALQQLRVKCKI